MSQLPPAEIPVLPMKTTLRLDQDELKGKELANRIIRKAKSMDNLSLKDKPQVPHPGDPGDSDNSTVGGMIIKADLWLEGKEW